MRLLAWAFVIAVFVAVALYALASAPNPEPLIEQVGQSIGSVWL